MDLIIDRSKWLRGEGSDYSYLIRAEDGKMCCLGFLGLACGIKPEVITNRVAPDVNACKQAWLAVGDKAGFLFRQGDVASPYRSDDCGELMKYNDSTSLTEEERESYLTAIFSRNGVTVKFIDHIAVAVATD